MYKAAGKKVYVPTIGTCTFIRTECEGHSRVLREEEVFIDCGRSIGYQQKIFIIKDQYIVQVLEDAE